MGLHGKPLTVSRYMTAARPHHPTAHADGRVRIHRAVLYDAIGPGVHACHWCRTEVEWFAAGGRELVADHLDEDTWNNNPSNLVASCQGCNASRRLSHATACKYGHEYTPENTYRRPDSGSRMCRTCLRAAERRKRERKRAA